MSTHTSIAWTDHTFNPVWGCAKVSPGCKNCYADSLSHRYGFDLWGRDKDRRTFGDKHWAEPAAWQKSALAEGRPHRTFCGSMCDVFEDHHTVAREREKLWLLIRSTPDLHWQLLTKRSDRIARCLPADWCVQRYPNVWLGVSIENGDYVFRADDLREIPAAVRFISYEPALGPLDGLDLGGIDWLIFGGESGFDFRTPVGWQDWARSLRDRCAQSGTAFFFKQSPAQKPGTGITLDGATLQRFPVPRTS